MAQILEQETIDLDVSGSVGSYRMFHGNLKSLVKRPYRVVSSKEGCRLFPHCEKAKTWGSCTLSLAYPGGLIGTWPLGSSWNPLTFLMHNQIFQNI